MTSIEFLRPRLEGARFDDGGVPLEFLSDLVALRELVLEVAKWRFLENHPERQRSPRGFTDDVGLKLIGLEGGSATPVIGLAATQSMALIPEVPYQRYLEEAVEYIVQDIDYVGTDASASPSGRLPRKYYAYFDRIGRSLREDEHIDFSVPSGRVSGRLDRNTRRKLLAISNIRELTQEVSLRGLVPEADQDRMTFELQPIYGHKVSGPIEEQHYETIVQAFNEFRSGMRILVNGVGSYNQQNRLLRLVSVGYISELDPLDVPARLDEFRSMQDGWLEGEGLAPSPEGLEWLSTSFESHYDDDVELPHTYPTEEGGIRMEWSVENNVLILEIDLDTRVGEWLWFDRDSEAEGERSLNLDDSGDWAWLVSEIRGKYETGEE